MLCPGEAIPNSNASTPAAGSSMVNTAEEAGVEGKVCHIDRPSIDLEYRVSQVICLDDQSLIPSIPTSIRSRREYYCE